jgi:hypothetical protein
MVANVAEPARYVDFFLRMARSAHLDPFSPGKIADQSLPGKTVGPRDL